MFVGTIPEVRARLDELEADPKTKGKRFKLAEERKRRTLTQNNYYWELLNRLARKLGLPDTEVHLNMLREYGVCQSLTVLSEVLEQGYMKYRDVVQEYTDQNGRRRCIVKWYLGSSLMDKAQFTHLLHGLIEECRLQGIETMTPRELAQLKYEGEA